MLTSYNWLKELLPALEHPPAEAAAALTRHSFETNLVREINIDPQITVSRITGIKPHPNADRLRLVTLDTGSETVTVVCGAANIQTGDVVPYAPPGTTVNDEKGEKFKIRLAKIRGVESPGMLASPRELGLGNIHDGIYTLPRETEIGSQLLSHIPPDTILEADITPNRAHDCLSHIGIARELAAIWNLDLEEPPVSTIDLPELAGEWSLEITIDEDALRYLGIHFTGVEVGMSPLSVQARLWAMGARPINNVVDLTNYLMFEWGVPTHAFDADKLPAKNIGVRRAAPNEALTALDGNQYRLNSDDLVIISGNQPVALAGIMGSSSTQVEEKTTSVFLEIANFRAYPVQQTSARLKINSEAAARHKKGISPAVIDNIVPRAVQLFSRFAGAATKGAIQFYPRQFRRLAIDFKPQTISKIAGIALPDRQALDILDRLRCKTNQQEGKWQVTPPVDRLDLTGPHDLIEEILRLAGHDLIPAKPPIPTKPASFTDKAAWREIIRDFLVASGGFEVLNFSFDDETAHRLINSAYPSDNQLQVDNPPSPEQQYLRHDLYPRLIAAAIGNKGELKRPSTKAERLLFEIGTVFSAGTGGAVEGVLEKDHLAILFLGEDANPGRVRGMIDDLLSLFNLNHESRIIPDIIEFPLGHPAANKLGMEAAVMELDLEQLAGLTEITPRWQAPKEDQLVTYRASAKYPASYRDLSLLLPSEIPVENVQEIINRTGKELVRDVDLFDIYTPDASESGTDQQSLAFHIMYQSSTRTLTDEEVNALHQTITRQLQTELGAAIR